MTANRLVTLRYFAAAAEAAGVQEQRLEVPPDATLAWLRDYLVNAYGAPMTAVISNGSFLVDGIAETRDAAAMGERVDVLPPFAGG